MQVVVTAVGPDHVGLADPLIHHVTGQGANIAEIQMYDHDEQALFAMLLRIEWPGEDLQSLRRDLAAIGVLKGLSVRVWSAAERQDRPRLAICTTYRDEPARALLQAINDGQVAAEPVLMMGNRNACRSLAEEFGVSWEMPGDGEGVVDETRMVELLDTHEIDYVVLARYMRVLSPAICWKFAGGRIINLHHGLLPSFPGLRPYHDAYASRMLTYGATCHYIVPELDAGNQIIYQSTYTIPPGMHLQEVIRQGEQENEPRCLVEGIRRVVAREVQLHFHRVVVPS
jgi:formyltetrahydrofolate deformylase